MRHGPIHQSTSFCPLSLQAMEKDTIKDENDAQKAYEDFVKETNSGITARSKEISDKSEQKGKAEIELAESKDQSMNKR
eukprot:4568527-Amphidinium_carterae.1